ncbi:MAG: hypothetical protein ACJ8B6_14320 [Gemmatimonadales bacterium]
MTDDCFSAHAGRGGAAAGAAVVLAMAIAACSPDAPSTTAPAVAAPASAVHAVALSGPTSQLLDDARGRLLSSLDEQQLRGRLQDRLTALAEALTAGDEPATRRQLALARKLVAASGRSLDGADLSALTLALDQIEARLDEPAAAPEQP